MKQRIDDAQAFPALTYAKRALSASSLVILIGVVALSPLPYASVELGWVAIWCAALAVCLLCVSLRGVERAHYLLLIPPLSLAALFTVVITWQVFPGPPALAHPIWEKAAKLLPSQVTPFVSIAPDRSWRALGGPLTVLLAFLCAFLVSVKRERAAILLKSTAAVGLIYAMYALIVFLNSHTEIVWSDQAQSFAALSGPFINRNHAATYFGTCALLWFALALAELERPLTSIGVLDAIRAVLEESPWRFVAFAGAFFTCITATFLTQSRAGIVLTLAVLVLYLGIFAFRFFSSHPKSIIAGAVIVLALALFVEFWGGAVAYRMGMLGLKDLGRWETFTSTVKIIQEYPVLGTGHGTFEAAFPPYRGDHLTTMLVWDHAHNTLLEITSELGIIVAAATFIVTLFLGWMLLRGALQRRRDSAIPLAALAVVLLAVTHSSVDFSLQIPAYAITCAVIVGCGLAQSLRSRVDRNDTGRR